MMENSVARAVPLGEKSRVSLAPILDANSGPLWLASVEVRLERPDQRGGWLGTQAGLRIGAHRVRAVARELIALADEWELP